VAERAGAIRRVADVLLPDALIAATGLVNGLPVMTRNKRDFDRVDGLEVLDPPAPGIDEEPTQLER
jgi:predicted nucleic acid-binding protein